MECGERTPVWDCGHCARALAAGGLEASGSLWMPWGTPLDGTQGRSYSAETHRMRIKDWTYLGLPCSMCVIETTCVCLQCLTPRHVVLKGRLDLVGKPCA